MISYYFHPHYSGSAVQARNLCGYLSPLGIECCIVSANLTGSPWREKLGDLEVFRLPVIKRGPLATLSFWFSLTIFLIWRRRFIDIVHSHGTYLHSIASVVARFLRKKTILKIAMSSSDLAFARQGRLWGRLNRFLVRRFDLFIATSEVIRQECLDLGVGAERIRLVPNGVDASVFRPAKSAGEQGALRRQLGLPDDGRPIVCFVGVIDGRKNADGILRMWANVRSRGVPGHLVLVGPTSGSSDEPTPFVRELLAFIERERLTDTVTFVGRKSNVAEYLRSADVFLFPSRREGMPNVVLEAMASGLPCVASSIGGTVDLIRHGETGYLFDVDDESRFADALSELLLDSGRAGRMGQAARQFILDRFALSKTAAEYDSIYASLLRASHDARSR
jgi:glycosyltransferase involved in cell wall biosynthesis